MSPTPVWLLVEVPTAGSLLPTVLAWKPSLPYPSPNSRVDVSHSESDKPANLSRHQSQGIPRAVEEEAIDSY